MDVFTTIASPKFSELVIIHTGYAIDHLPEEVAFFETLRKMNEVKRFKLVFLLEVEEFWDPRLELVKALDSVAAKGLLGFLGSPPTMRTVRPRYCKWDSLAFD